jgi:hypothetical protein
MSYNVDGYTSTLASKVLGFLVESGMLYILIGVSSISAHMHDRVIINKPFFFSSGRRLGLLLHPRVLCDTRRRISARGCTTRSAYSLLNDQPRTLLIPQCLTF